MARRRVGTTVETSAGRRLRVRVAVSDEKVTSILACERECSALACVHKFVPVCVSGRVGDP